MVGENGQNQLTFTDNLSSCNQLHTCSILQMTETTTDCAIILYAQVLKG